MHELKKKNNNKKKKSNKEQAHHCCMLLPLHARASSWQARRLLFHAIIIGGSLQLSPEHPQEQGTFHT
jgi:hypothetical protein